MDDSKGKEHIPSKVINRKINLIIFLLTVVLLLTISILLNNLGII